MSATTSSEESSHIRRRLLRNRAITLAVAAIVAMGLVKAQSIRVPPVKPRTNTPFGPRKQIDAGLLNVGYVEAGPADGPAVILLHGWPYDIHSYADVTPLLASAVYRVIVPYLRGYGTTRFLSSETFRNGQQSAVAVDIIKLMDALKIERATIAGFDWGARTADIIAALWPERCKGLVSVSGYLIGTPESNKKPLPPKAELAWWYQFYFATERGRAGYEKYRRDFAKLIWQTASPKWNFDDATFNRSAASFDNPDHVAIVIHNYRWRIGAAAGEPQYDDLERRLAEAPVITAPTITLEGDANGAPYPDPASYRNKFSGKYLHRTITGGIGHNLPQEAPQGCRYLLHDRDQKFCRQFRETLVAGGVKCLALPARSPNKDRETAVTVGTVELRIPHDSAFRIIGIGAKLHFWRRIALYDVRGGDKPRRLVSERHYKGSPGRFRAMGL